MKNKKTTLIKSFLALLLCVATLVGSTFAWFSDNESSNGNIIQSGNLDIEMYWTDDLNSGVWYNVEEDAHNTIFSYENWEPGYTDVKYIKLVNNGNLALNYKLTLAPQTAVGKLAEVINVYFANSGVDVSTRDDLDNLSSIGLLNNVLNGGATANGTLLPADQYSPLHPSGEIIMTFAMNMITTAGNDYQGQASGNFTIKALATQAAFESDSFGTDYDNSADFPFTLSASTVTMPVTAVDGKVPTGGVAMNGDGVSAFVPEGVALEDNTENLTLSITPLENTTSGISAVNDEFLIPVDIHIDGVSEDNTVPIIIDLGEILPKYLNMGNYHLYHVEDGTNNEMSLVNGKANLTAHNQFTYDPLTGAVTVAMASFSEVAVLSETDGAWKGEFDYTWYDKTKTDLTIANGDQLAAFGSIVGGMNDQTRDSFEGKTVKLLTDINLGDSEKSPNANIIFHPIGYYYKDGDSKVQSFEGIFDGNGHKISNFYQNTWEIKGDYDGTYYKDAMGLFGYVKGGTIRNLTVENFESDGEFTPTGVITAYADGNSTFENIAITNCNPRVYNTGNGGIIGIAGDTSDSDDDHIILKNITVDNSNKISALWGSYDVACGGLVGMYRGNVDGSGNATGDTISFNNCHVSAQMDVYNDVCGNYQYYAYRYAGMIIGSVRHNTKNAEGKIIPNMKGISAEKCTVNYGDWNDYYYCEFVKNGHPSYSGPDDYKFSRVPDSELDFTDPNNVKCTHNHSDAENNKAIYLPFHQLFTGYSWGVSSIGLEKYSGIVTDLGITEGDQEKSVEKFRIKFPGKVLGNTNEVSLGELFKAMDGVTINNSGVVATVDKVDKDANVSGTFKADADDWTKGKIEFEGTGEVKITIQDYNFCTPTVLTVNIINGETPGVEKFETKFTGDFLYRVGNINTVSVGSLFDAAFILGTDGKPTAEKHEINASGVVVSIDKVDENSNVSGTFTANATDWTQGTIQFSGTGVVKITIQDDNFCAPTVLRVEVVDAVNATTATSATENNVVLLNDCGFSSLEVSGGYTLYGNGFTMTCGSDSVAIDRTYSFVELKGGTLDNVRIITPNFSHAIMYEKNKSENNNKYETDSSGRTRYNNIRSAVLVSKTSNITNSYISGGRAAIYATTGTLNIKNSTIYGGAVANIQTELSSKLVLEDVTLIQKPIKANVNDTSKTIMGLSVVNMCDTEGNGANITLKGYLHQYAWANSDYKKYVPSDAQSVVDEVLDKTDFVHEITYSDGVTRASVNLGFLNMPNGTAATNQGNISDFKSYAWVTVSGVANIFTYKNSDGTDDAVMTEPEYNANTQGSVLPTLNYTDISDNRIFTTTYDETKSQWKSTLKVDVDASIYDFSFDKLLAQKNGKNLEYTVKTKDDVTVDKNAVITLDSAISNEYVLTITDDQVYDKNGNPLDPTTHSYIFELVSTKTSLPAPTWTSETLNGTPYIVVDSKDGDWNCAVPVLDGLKVKYWSKKQNTEIELDLANVVSDAGLSQGLQNGSNNTITITVADEYTLTVTTTGFKTNDNGKPVVVNGKLYFTVSSSSNYVSTKTTDRTVSISYDFTDANNSDPLTLSTSFKVVYATYKGTQYKYSDFCNGKLTEATCITPDTLITLADGTQKRVDQLTGEEMLLVWNLETGKYDIAPIVFVDTENETEYEIVHLYFSDGSDVKIIDEHGFFDVDLQKYVYIDAQNYTDYVGHKFIKQGDIFNNTWDTVTLDNVVIEKEITTAWSPVTFEHLCYYTNGVLSMPGGIEGLFNIFEVDTDTMSYDKEQMQKDIETYGLFTFEDFNGLIPEIAFEAFNGDYLKVAIGKGLLTWEDIVAMAERYIPLM